MRAASAGAAAILALASVPAAAQVPPPVLVPPLHPPLPLPAPPQPPSQQVQPGAAEGGPRRDPREQEQTRRRRPRAPGADRVLPPMRCLEAAAFDPPIDEPVTSSGNYELWIDAGRPREEPPPPEGRI